MRFAFLFILYSASVFSQLDTGNGTVDCIHDGVTSFASALPPYECKDLIISAPLSTTDFNNPSNLPIVIQVSGTVSISASIDFSGGDGEDFTSGSPLGGGDGGPGAGDGGEWSTNSEPGLPLTRGGKIASPSDCGAFNPGDEAEGGGGGGGSLFVPSLLTAVDGDHTDGVGTTASLAGDQGDPLSGTFNVASFNVAGAGGASGEAGCQPGVTLPGSGGGGGGGLHIIAAGDVAINALIDVRGGNGGAGQNDPSGAGGGGGGGGSGGIVAIQTLSQILLNANINASAGSGGNGGNGANGGGGSLGVVYLEDEDGVVDESLVVGPNPIVRSNGVTSDPTPGASTKLTSGISCGNISDKNQYRVLWQNLIGFMASLMIGYSLKILFQRRKKFAWKSVRPS